VETGVDLDGVQAGPVLMLDFHASPRGNSVYTYTFIRGLVCRYDRAPIYVDGAGCTPMTAGGPGSSTSYAINPWRTYGTLDPVHEGLNGDIR